MTPMNMSQRFSTLQLQKVIFSHDCAVYQRAKMRSVFLEHENPHAFKELKQNLDCTMIGQQSVPHICLRFPSTRSFATTCYTWTTSQVFHLGLIGKVWLQQDRATHILISVCTSTSVTCSRQVNWQWLVTITCPFGWVYQTPFVL